MAGVEDDIPETGTDDLQEAEDHPAQQQPDDNPEPADPADQGGAGDQGMDPADKEEEPDDAVRAYAEVVELLRQQHEFVREQYRDLQELRNNPQGERGQPRPDAAEAPTEEGFRGTPVSRLMTYDGSTPWLEYEAHLEEYAGTFGWTEEKKAQYLCLSLRGVAQGALLGLSPEEQRN